MRSMLPGLLFASVLLSASCANDDLIARFTRETDISLRANCTCPSNGTTETCLAEVATFYPSEERMNCQRRVLAQYPEAGVYIECITSALQAFRPCFDEALRDCATVRASSCGPDFTTRTNDCVGPTDAAGEAWARCMR